MLDAGRKKSFASQLRRPMLYETLLQWYKTAAPKVSVSARFLTTRAGQNRVATWSQFRSIQPGGYRSRF